MGDPHEIITELRRLADPYTDLVKACRDAAVVIEERLAYEKHQAESWRIELREAADRIDTLDAALREIDLIVGGCKSDAEKLLMVGTIIHECMHHGAMEPKREALREAHDA